MRQTKIVLSQFCGLFLLFGSIGAGAETAEIDCSVEPYSGTIFSPLYQSTQETALSFCRSLMQTRIKKNAIDTRDINVRARSLLTDFAAVSKKALDDKSLFESASYQDQFSQLDKTFQKFDFNDPRLPELNVAKVLGVSRVEGYFMPLLESENRFDINEVDQCGVVSSGVSCRGLFEDFASAFNPYRSAYNNVYDNSKALDKLGNEWDRFLEISKSQTALEVFLTTRVQRSHFKKNHLVGPPSYQVIALHPHLIYSHMDDAPDGIDQEMGLALEWIGVNFWDWKVPFGLSFATTHVDRAGFNDTGKGVMLHIDNHYAIGWADHGDEDTVYVTLDLLKLFEEKQQQYQAYLDQYFD